MRDYITHFVWGRNDPIDNFGIQAYLCPWGHIDPTPKGLISMRADEVKELLDSRALLPLWPETGSILGLCRNTTYDAAARGDIKTVRFGRLKRVPTAWLRQKLGLCAGLITAEEALENATSLREGRSPPETNRGPRARTAIAAPKGEASPGAGMTAPADGTS